MICLVNSDNERDSVLLMFIKGSEADTGLGGLEISAHKTYSSDNWGFIIEQVVSLGVGGRGGGPPRFSVKKSSRVLKALKVILFHWSR